MYFKKYYSPEWVKIVLILTINHRLESILLFVRRKIVPIPWMLIINEESSVNKILTRSSKGEVL